MEREGKFTPDLSERSPDRHGTHVNLGMAHVDLGDIDLGMAHVDLGDVERVDLCNREVRALLEKRLGLGEREREAWVPLPPRQTCQITKWSNLSNHKVVKLIKSQSGQTYQITKWSNLSNHKVVKLVKSQSGQVEFSGNQSSVSVQDASEAA